MPLIGLYFCFLPFPSARVYWFSCPMYVQCAVPAAGTIFSCSLVLSSGHCHPPVLAAIAVSALRSPLASGRHDYCPTATCSRASSPSSCLLRRRPSAYSRMPPLPSGVDPDLGPLHVVNVLLLSHSGHTRGPRTTPRRVADHQTTSNSTTPAAASKKTPQLPGMLRLMLVCSHASLCH